MVATPAAEPRRERNAALTRQKLLDCAEHEFAARGFAGARLREIAVLAGVQPALIHHYFTDKHGLYRAVLDRALLPTTAASLSLVEANPSLEMLVSGSVRMLLRFHAEHGNLLAILRHESVSESSVMVEVLRERTEPTVKAIRRYIENCQKRGEVRADVTADELILLTLSAAAYPFADANLVSAVLPSATPRDPAALERRAQALTRLVLSSLRP